MSTLAKVFVILNLFLSLLFFGTSATLFLTRETFHEARVQEEKTFNEQVRRLKREVLKQGAAVELAREAVLKLRGTETQLATDVKMKSEQAKAARTEAISSKSSRDKAVALQTAAEQQVAALENRLKELTTNLQDATSKRDDAVKLSENASEQRSRAQRDLEEANKAIAAKRIEYTSLADKYQVLELRYKILAKRYDGPIPTNPTQALSAKIVAVERKQKAVVLNVGRDDDVKENDEFNVSRGGKYLGKVRVTKLYPDNCGAKIIVEAEGVAMRAGDSARTGS